MAASKLRIGDVVDGYRFNGGDPNDVNSWGVVETAQKLAAGDVVDGYRFKGGNPNDKASWEDVREPGLLNRIGGGVRATQTAIELSSTGKEPEKLAETIAEGERKALPGTQAQQKILGELAPAVKKAEEAKGVFPIIGAYATLGAKAISQFAQNPAEFAGMVAENLPNAVPGLLGSVAGAAAGAPAGPLGVAGGAIAGGAGTGYLVEQGAAFREQVLKEARERNIDPRDAKALAPLIAEKYDEFLEASRLKGIGTAGTDAVLNVLTLGLASGPLRRVAREIDQTAEAVRAGKIAPAEGTARLAALEAQAAASKGVLPTVGRGAAILGAESIGEGVSEAVGQKLAYGKVDPLDVVYESIAGVGQGAALAGAQGLMRKALPSTFDPAQEAASRARAALAAATDVDSMAAAAMELAGNLDSILAQTVEGELAPQMQDALQAMGAVTPEQAAAQVEQADVAGMLTEFNRQQDVRAAGQPVASGILDLLTEGDQDAFRAAYDAVSARNGVATPSQAAVLDRMSPTERLYDRVEGQIPEAGKRPFSGGEPVIGQQAGGVTIESGPRNRASVGERLGKIEAELQQEAAAAKEAKAQEDANIPAAAPAPDVVMSALKVDPAARTAAQVALINTAQSRMPAEDFALLQKGARSSFDLTSEERVRLQGLMRQSVFRIAEANIQASSDRNTFTVRDRGRVFTLQRSSGLTQAPKGVTALIEGLGRMFGKEVIFFEPATGLDADGFVLPNNSKQLFIRSRTSISPLAVFGHELMHLLKRDNPKAYAAVQAVLEARFTDELKERYAKDYGEGANLEELSSDLLGNAFQDPDFIKAVFAEISAQVPSGAASVIMRFAATVSKAVRQAMDVVRNLPVDAKFKADEMMGDLTEIRSALKSALADYAKQQRIPALEMEAQRLRAEKDINLESQNAREQVADQDRLLPSQSRGGETPSYGVAREGAISVIGRHYSNAERTSLSGRAYGTGLKGAEIARLQAAEDDRLRQRIYFYADTGSGITPEVGVGAVAHEVQLENIYDPETRIIAPQPNSNAFEAAVIDAGFDGYIAPFGNQAAVVLLGPKHTNVPVQSLARIQRSAARRGGVAEDVGEFKIRTQKDGTLGVAGDVNAIRALLPEGVKGRPIPGGILFTTADAPRVRAALEGRKVAYGRGGQVVDKLPMRDGKYVGAPEKYNTPGKITALRKNLRRLSLEGERGRFWYENSSKAILDMVKGNVQEARKFVALLSIYSPQAKVDANSTFALRAWAQYKAGQPISVKTASADAKATAAMDDIDAFWSGEKTGNFFTNLLREIDPSTAGKQGATIDLWMMRAAEYATDAPSSTQYAFMENETNRLAKELGWEPQQVQAAIWVAMKARMENAGVKKRTENTSEKKGWIRFDYPIKNGRPTKTRVVINAKSHRDNWLKHAFAHTPTADDTEQAKFDFSDGVRRHIGQLSWEARPGRPTNVLPGIHDAPYEQQVEFQQDIQKALLDENGIDLAAYKVGLLVDGPDILAPGVWQGDISAGMQKLVAMAPAKGPEGRTNLDPAQKKALDAYASILGLLLRQDAVAYHRPFYKSNKSQANGVSLDVGRALSFSEMQSLWGALDSEMKKAGFPTWEAGTGIVSSPFGVRVVNSGAIKDNATFRGVVEKAASTLSVDEIRMGFFAADTGSVNNNWRENPNGENYQSRITSVGGPDLLEWARTALAPRVQSVFEQYSAKYGWGDPGRIQFSRARSGRETARELAPLAGAPNVVGASGPDARLVRVAEQYARENGIDLRRQSEYVKVDPDRARRIAQAYDEMAHAPQDPKVREAYENLIRQTLKQYEALTQAGYRFYFFDENNDPYGGNPWNAMRDLRANQVMGVFATESGFGSGATDLNVDNNPLLADTGLTWPYASLDGEPKRVLANDLFRAVHDAFGHGLEGAGFRADGEENAWQAHVRLFTGSAVGAITSETRGQNSWLNYGPFGERNRNARVEDTVFADQKTGLMPEWTWSDGRVGDAQLSRQRQTDTPEFKRWFGDSKAVVAVNAETGAPLTSSREPKKLVPQVMYHTTRNDFTEFEIGRITKNSGTFGDWETSRAAVFVTPDLEASQAYGTQGGEFAQGANVMPLYIKAENPLDLTGGVSEAAEQKLLTAGMSQGFINNELGNWTMFDGDDGRAVADAIKAAGYDSVIFNDQNPNTGDSFEAYAVFSSEQIKSATGNSGAFDPNNPDITASRQRQTNTPEFKRWFGDSKVVDAEGKPLVVYHGTGENFTSFDRARQGAGNFGAGFYFGDENTAESFGPTSMAVYLKMQRPLVVDNLSDTELQKWETLWDEGDPKRAQELAKQEGYDGIIGYGMYVVFDPTQIKSATGNIGAFDPNNPDITASRQRQTNTPEFKRWFGDSKVVDENGEPVVMYHGSPSDITAFKAHDADGIYFSSDPTYAGNYGEVKAEVFGGSATVYPVYLSIKNPLVLDGDNQDQWDRYTSRGYDKRDLKKQGYDGVVMRYADGEIEAMAFRPEQIKSATGNIGAFDPNNPDITASRQRTSLGFYSALADGVANIKTNAAPPAGWKDAIKGLVNKGQVKADEVEWSGVNDWLDLQTGKVTRDQLQQYLEQGGVQVEETVLGDPRGLPKLLSDYFENTTVRQPTTTEGWIEEAARQERKARQFQAQGLPDTAKRFFELAEAMNAYAESGETGALATKYSKYQLPGGENYREVLLTLPSKTPLESKTYAVGYTENSVTPFNTRAEAEQFRDTAMRGANIYERDREGDASSYNSKSDYQSPHWDQRNVLAHIRMNDRISADGKRVLFIEEIQSDWGQEGKKTGFSARPNEARVQEINARLRQLAKADMEFDPEWDALIEEKEALTKPGIPAAPFVTKTEGWLNLALKRIITMAAEGGYDQVAFINGEQSADRYDLSKQVSQIIWDPKNETLVATPVQGEPRIERSGVSESDLADIIGKEAAQKLTAPEAKQPDGRHRIKGNDLKVGGEGMKTFYDTIVPTALKKLLPKVGGGRMEVVTFNSRFDLVEHGGGWVVTDTKNNSYYRGPNATKPWVDDIASAKIYLSEGSAESAAQSLDGQDDGAGVQPGFDVTPEMAAKVEEGLPLFSRQRQTDTPEFKRWFGDSKVVDAEGKPLVVYHGAKEDIEDGIFRMEKGMLGTGAYFTSNPKEAEFYTQNAVWRTNPNIVAAYVSIKNPYYAKDKWDKGAFKARENGHDGVILIAPGGGIDWVIPFDPTQIKSATGNIGAFDPNNPDITSSTARKNIFGRPVPLSSWNAPVESRLDSLAYLYADKQVDLRKVVDAIRKTSKEIDDQVDPSLQETLFSGRTAKATQDFLNKELRPLMDEMRLRKVSVREFEEYLHNRTAEERNIQIASINPQFPDGGSGIDTADARAYLAKLPTEKRKSFEALAKKVDALTKGTRELLVDSGLETADTVAAWESTYSSYVPLFREDLDFTSEQAGMGTGMGFQTKGAASRRAMGSDKPVVDILANLVMQRERTIVRAEKARVGRAVYALAASNPNTDFWLAVDPDAEKDPTVAIGNLISMGLNPIDAENIVREPRQTYIDPTTGLVAQRVNPSLRNSPNVLAVRIDGDEKYVFFNAGNDRAQRMVSALKGMDADQLGRVMSMAAKVTRYFASINTQYNPIFGAVNFARDVQSAMLQLSTTPIADQKKKVLENVGPALLAIYRSVRAERAGSGMPANAMSQLWDEFQREGAKTGFRDLFLDSEQRAEALQRMLDPSSWADSDLGKVFTIDGRLKVPMEVARKTAEPIFNWLSDYNETMENAVRLAAYKVAKDKGLSAARAADLAKNLTVNFNRKGQVATQVGALYAFFNAAMQGTVRMYQTLTGPAGKVILGGGLTLGVVQALALAFAGFEDEEPPTFVKERNLVIPLADGKYLTVPMPLGYNVIPNTSRILTEWMLSGGKNTTKRVADLTGAFMETFNPVGNAGWSVQTLTPTIVDPVAALTENRDWTGKPIARQDMSGLNPTPGYTRAKDTASVFSKELSYFLNLASGGTKYQKGLISPTPDQLDYLIGQLTGGVGRELLKVEQTVTSSVTGEELPPSKVPILGRLYGDTKAGASESAKFYDNLVRLNAHENEIKGRAKNREKPDAYIREHPEARLVPLANKVERTVRDLRTRKRELLERDAPPEQIKRVEEQIKLQMKNFNDRVRAQEK